MPLPETLLANEFHGRHFKQKPKPGVEALARAKVGSAGQSGPREPSCTSIQAERSAGVNQ